MAWLAVSKDGTEGIYEDKPERYRAYWYADTYWGDEHYNGFCYLPKGSIKKLIGRELTWEDDPVMLEE